MGAVLDPFHAIYTAFLSDSRPAPYSHGGDPSSHRPRGQGALLLQPGELQVRSGAPSTPPFSHFFIHFYAFFQGFSMIFIDFLTFFARCPRLGAVSKDQRLEREMLRLEMQVKRFELFREDVRDLVELTVGRMDVYHLVGALFLEPLGAREPRER